MPGMLQDTGWTFGHNRTFEWFSVARQTVVVRFVGSARYDTSISQYDTARVTTNQTAFVDMQRYLGIRERFACRSCSLHEVRITRMEWYHNLSVSG